MSSPAISARISAETSAGPGVVIVAAGAGRRLGGVAKAALRLADGTSYLQAVRDVAVAAGAARLVVVIGPPHDAVTGREAARLGLAVAHNPDPSRGMGSSVAVGFAHAAAHFAAAKVALLWPVDHPRVAVDTVRAVLARAAQGCIVIPVFAGRGGHPTAFGRELWTELAECASAPQGARSVVNALQSAAPDRVLRMAVTDPGVVTDVDTPAAAQTTRAQGKTDTLPDTSQ